MISPVVMTKATDVSVRRRERAMNESGRKRTTLSGERARQGRIVLNTPVRRMIFFGAFAAIGLFCVLTLVIAAATMAGR